MNSQELPPVEPYKKDDAPGKSIFSKSLKNQLADANIEYDK